jgi:Flp pilus assembly protein TadG
MRTHRPPVVSRLPHRRGVAPGQALVEFSLALIPFLLIVMGIFDLGRAIYMSNGINEAAREIARTTAVHLCQPSSCTLGNSAETTATINVQKGLVPGLGGASSSIRFACTDVSDATLSTTDCHGYEFVKVTVSVPYSALTPILSMVAPTTLSASAHVEVPAPYEAP